MDEETRARMRAAARRVDRINAWLHIGGALPPEEYGKLKDAGVTHVVDLREEHEDIGDVSGLDALGISRRQLPVRNQSAPRFEQMVEVTQWFDANDEQATLYVHCGGGFGRAAVMSAALLVHAGAGVDAAVDLLRQARPEIRLNEEQMRWLRQVEARLKGSHPGPA
jgi:protein-tyrosine phosphatase